MMDLRAGNVIRIATNDYVVVNTNTVVSEDGIRRDSYRAYQFTTIAREDLEKENPNEKVWTLKDISSMTGPNEILSDKVEIVDQVKIKAPATFKM